MIITRGSNVGVLQRKSQTSLQRHVDSRLLKAVLFMSLALLTMIMLCVWSRLEVVRLGYEISKLQQAELQLREESKKLRLEIASLSALQRIEYIAVTKLGMIQPRDKDVIFLK